MFSSLVCFGPFVFTRSQTELWRILVAMRKVKKFTCEFWLAGWLEHTGFAHSLDVISVFNNAMETVESCRDKCESVSIPEHWLGLGVAFALLLYVFCSHSVLFSKSVDVIHGKCI